MDVAHPRAETLTPLGLAIWRMLPARGYVRAQDRECGVTFHGRRRDGRKFVWFGLTRRPEWNIRRSLDGERLLVFHGWRTTPWIMGIPLPAYLRRSAYWHHNSQFRSYSLAAR